MKEIINVPVEEFNEVYLSQHQSSPSHILGAARGLYEIQQPSTDASAILNILDRLTGEGVPPRIPIFIESIELLKKAGATEDQLSEFQNKIKSRVPLAEVFASSEEKKKRREEVMKAQEEV